ncbi:tail fiber assembly protein [Citrobacter portucalensis]|uniref:tail fiber assembly protein n=1 Tax=Citrobacter portucalensis TaxID=1639133 RepID=UPI0030CDA3EF|nr:tail fiber assembly protein [Citrobacter freundii]
MYYSKSVSGFIPDQWMEDGTYNPVPTDAIKLTKQEIKEFHCVSIPGKMVDVINGRLVWVDPTPPTHDEQVVAADAEKSRRINEANDYMNRKQWPGKVAIGRLKEDELAQYNLWLDYLDALEAIDTSMVPDLEWPYLPE